MRVSRRVPDGWGMIFGLLGFLGSAWSEPVDPFAPGAKAEEPPREWIWYTGLTVQLEYIGVSAEEYFRLSDAHWRDRGMAMRKEVEKMIGEGKAEVLETVAVKTRDRERARVESVLEFWYPTEFDVPEGLKEPVPESARKKFSEMEDAEWEALLPHVARGAMTGFDVRNVGITCEVDPVMGADGVTVDLNFAPEITDMVGQVPQTVIAGRETGVNQPNLFTRRLSTADSHRSGEHVFQTAFSPPGADGAPDRTKKVMLFTRVLVHRVEESEEELKAREEEMRRWEERHGVESAEGKADPFAPAVPKGEEKKVEKFERPEEPRGVSLQFEFFKVDHGEVTRLLNGYDPAKDEDGKGLRGAVKKMEAAGKAELLELLVTRTKGGTRSKVEAIHEVIYTNDFEPPTHPDEKALNQRLREKRLREADLEDEGEGEAALPEKSEAVAVMLEDGEAKEGQHVFRSVPNSFDRRNTGRWVEVDPVVTRNGRVQLALAPESVRLIRWEDYGPGVKVPLFFREAASTSIVIQSGGYALVSVGAPLERMEKRTGNTGRWFLSMPWFTGIRMHQSEVTMRSMMNQKTRGNFLFVWLAALLVCFVPDGRAEELDGSLTLRFEWVEMPTMALWKLVREAPPAENDVTEFYARVRALVKKGEAKILDINRIRTRSGQRARVESINELLYPTEFEPPGIPSKLPDGFYERQEMYRKRLMVEPPSRFDVRNLGTSIEVDPVTSSDGTTIDLNVAPQMVSLGRWETTQEHFGLATGWREPVCNSMRLSTAVTLLNGRPRFLGAMTPPGEGGVVDKGRKVLLFAWGETGTEVPPGVGEETERRQLTVAFEWVDVEQKTVAKLLEKREIEGDSSGLKDEVDALVLKGEAKVREMAMIRTRSRQRAKVESIEQIIYPIEFEAQERWPNEVRAKPATVEELLKRWRDFPKATAFNVRYVGTTVEVDPVINEDETVDLNAEPEIVEHHGDIWHGAVKGDKTGRSGLPQPLFATTRAKFATQMFSSGEPVLVSVRAPQVREGDKLQADPKWRTMLFVRSLVSGEGK